MTRPDLNLLVALDVLLTEGGVAPAARRLRLSPSAMSRTLARLREATGDPLLVRAGRGLVPTPRALELREGLGPLVEAAEAALSPVAAPDLSGLERTFVLRVADGFAESFGPALMARLASEAPRVRLRFVAKLDRDSAGLRRGEFDLETGVIGRSTGPEVRAQALFRDRFVAVVAAAHPLAGTRLTPAAYRAARHVAVTRNGDDQGPLDETLRAAGLERDVAVMASGFSQALALAREAGLVATVPERHTAALRQGMAPPLALPVETPPILVSMLWHPRLEADPAHRWLRGCVREVCAG